MKLMENDKVEFILVYEKICVFLPLILILYAVFENFVLCIFVKLLCTYSVT